VPDLVFEVGCEELPARACAEAERQLAGLVPAALAEAGIAPADVRVHVAPRRLAALATGLPAERPAERRESRGPRADAPERAREGFARRHGLAPGDLVERDGFLWAVSEGAPTPAAQLVPAAVERAVAGLSFMQTMRWDGGERFPRPIRWLVALLDGDVVPATVAGVAAGNTSFGHRVLGGPARIRGAASYLDDLRAVCVVPDARERRATIVAGLDGAGRWDDPMAKLDEVVHLVEWPQVLVGEFDRRYLELPELVSVTAMQSHQRYFPLREEDGGLAPRFAFVANGARRPDVVTRGNEEVLVGRLEDAAFAFRRDRERGVAAMRDELDRVSFLEGAGSLADKAGRLGALVEQLAMTNDVPAGDRDAALRAAALAKADLVSGLVAEFATLQGYAGALYARAAGEPDDVCAAIEEHHRPVEAGGELPASAAGALLALADKADTVAVAFALGAQPTGSRDPYGIRRAAAGLIAIALERGLTVAPPELLHRSITLLVEQGHEPRRPILEAVPHAVAFVLDRVETALADEGVTVEELRAARGSGATEPREVAGLAWALRDLRGDPRLGALRDAYGRCVRIAARGVELAPDELRVDLLREPAERELTAAVESLQTDLADAVARRDFRGALERAAAIVPAVDRLFEDVLVMAEDTELRANRLRLVANVAATLRVLGDFEQLPG
jgi:glycyl-tRNA synthetase beta chain